MPYIGRAPTSTATKLEDADQDTKIQVEESSDEDTIRFDIAGAEDFTMSANAFNVLSGSTLNIASGATITNSGTANGLADDMEAAYAGVLQTNANFVDQVIFGPSVDGVPWNGAWSKASVFSSLMLATIEDEGSNTEINIWDLTEQSSGVISTTPLATVDLASAATPTSIAASMGYLIVGSEDGIAIIDPHSGAWDERTAGWPRTLSSSTTPALTNNDVTAVAAGLSSTSPLDPRTGGPLPVFGCAYGTGADVGSLIKYDGNVWDLAATIGPETVCGFVDDRIALAQENSGNQVLASTTTIDLIVADDWAVSAYSGDNNTQQFSLGANTAATFHNSDSVFADTTGLTIRRNDFIGSTAAMQGVSAMVTRAFNTGFLINYTKGAWLANSKTVDRSGNSNTLTENGTVTEAAVETSAELLGYSGFSTSNYLSRAADADWASFANGNVYVSVWFKTSGNSAFEEFVTLRKATPPVRIDIYMEATGVVGFECYGDAGERSINSTGTYDDGEWHKLDGVQVSNTERLLYVDGVHVGTNTDDSGSLTGADIILGIGARGHDGSVPATSSTLSLARLSATAPTATQIRQMYDAEKGMFVASAECLLQSGSTDAVLDVDVDPLSGKVLVTQTDAITIFDGLVVDSKPTVNSGNSEKGKLWGALRAEQNSANAYVTAPATDQRQVNEMVRGLASDLPAGVDLSKAKAWLKLNGTGTIAITSSYNIAYVDDNGTGQYNIYFGVNFKNNNYIVLLTAGETNDVIATVIAQDNPYGKGPTLRINTASHDGTDQDVNPVFMVAFGELENE